MCRCVGYNIAKTQAIVQDARGRLWLENVENVERTLDLVESKAFSQIYGRGFAL